MRMQKRSYALSSLRILEQREILVKVTRNAMLVTIVQSMATVIWKKRLNAILVLCTTQMISYAIAATLDMSMLANIKSAFKSVALKEHSALRMNNASIIDV